MPKRPPKDLGPSGRQLWKDIEGSGLWDLRADELHILWSACCKADTIADYTAALEGEPYTVKGSQGQPVMHPLRDALEKLHMEKSVLLGRLKLETPPSEDESEDSDDNDGVVLRLTASEYGKLGAKKRWGTR